MERITAQKALYIKLGEKGRWETECLENGILRVGYHNIPTSLCKKRNWQEVTALYLSQNAKAGNATRHTNELREFYEAGAETLWITFSARRLWWGFAKGPVSLGTDDDKQREMAQKWSSTDINGKLLDVAEISSRLTQVRGFLGTICEVHELDYLLRKINGEVLPEVKTAKEARDALLASMVPLIQNLTWQDFELLVDLVFSSGGWRRVGVLGKTEKDIDIDMIQPVTQERVMVQVKAKSWIEVARKVAETATVMKHFNRVFLVTHTFQGRISKEGLGEQFEILDVNRLAPLVLDAGLSDWLITKSN